MQIPKSRFVVLGAAVLMAIVMGGIGAGRANKDSKDSADKTPMFGGGSGKRVEVIKPRRGPIATSVEAPGTVQAGSEVGIGAPFEGRVIELLKDTGDEVKEGEVVFRLDPTDREEDVKEAELALARNKAAMDEASAERAEAERKDTELKSEPSDVTDARLRMRQSKLSLTRAEAQLETAAGKLARAKGMLAEGIGREFDVETAQGEHRVNVIGVRIAGEELKLATETLHFKISSWTRSRAESGKALVVSRAREARARADVRTSELTLQQKQRDLGRTKILAPIDGVITSRGVNQGDLVVRLTGAETHYIVSDLRHLLVYSDVDEGDVVDVRRGQTATVNVNALGHRSRLDGTVYSVGYRARTAAGEQVSTFTVRVLIKPGQERLSGLRPGMNGAVTIETNRKEDVLKVPLQAFLQRERDELPEELTLPEGLDSGLKDVRPDTLLDVLYVLVDGKAEIRIVRRGLADDDEAEVLDGLEEDALIVLGPFRTLDKLKPGDTIQGDLNEDLLPADIAPVTTKD
jgi:multidrug efflux pump subunit AcrA (membrane-fusion protein)